MKYLKLYNESSTQEYYSELKPDDIDIANNTMKHIKLINEYNSDQYYTEIKSSDPIFRQTCLEFTDKEIEKLTDITYSDNHYFNLRISPNKKYISILIGYHETEIYKHSDEYYTLSVYIRKYPDEYFYVDISYYKYTKRKMKEFPALIDPDYFVCDQLDGLLKLLQDKI